MNAGLNDCRLDGPWEILRNSQPIVTFRIQLKVWSEAMRLAAICLVALAFSSVAAFSQERDTSLMSPGGAPTAIAWPAPIGHRQPKMSDLHPDVAHREMQPGEPSSGPDQRNLNSRLTICRGC
jgi:hypothetical protein